MAKKRIKKLDQDDLEYAAANSVAGMFMLAIHNDLSSKTANVLFDYLLGMFNKEAPLPINYLSYVCVDQMLNLEFSFDDTKNIIRELLGDHELCDWFLEQLQWMYLHRKKDLN